MMNSGRPRSFMNLWQHRSRFSVAIARFCLARQSTGAIFEIGNKLRLGEKSHSSVSRSLPAVALVIGLLPVLALGLAAFSY